MKNKTLYLNSVYALSMLLIIVMRILFSAGVFSGISDMANDALWDVSVQIISMGIIPFALCVLYLKKRGEKKPAKSLMTEFGYAKKVSLKGWVLVVIISVLSTYVITCVSNAWYTLITMMGYKPPITPDEQPYSAAKLIFEIFFTACLPAVFEEFSNRGVLYHAHDGNREKPLRVIVLTAVMFALMHTSVKQVGYTFVFGLVTGALVYVTRSIWPAMLAHFINNFVSVMRTFGRVNLNGKTFLNYAYDWLFGSVAGCVVASLLFIIVVATVFFLIVKLGDVESTHRLNNGETVDLDENPKKRGKYDNLPLWFAASLNTIVTIFTLVWGIIR